MSGITLTSSPNALEGVWNLEKPKSSKEAVFGELYWGKSLLLSGKTWQHDGE